jgi:hypothetical protein
MRKLIYFLLCVILFSCEKESTKNDSQNNTKLIAKIISGNNQKGYVFQELANSLVIKISDKDSIPYRSAKFKYLQHGESGIVCKSYNDIPGEYLFRWLLSCSVGNLNVSIIAFDSINRIIDTLHFTAISQYTNTWNRACGLPVDSCKFTFDRTEIIIKHPDNRLFLHSLDRRELYVSIDQGVSWSKTYQFDYTVYGSVINFSIAQDGTLYFSSEKGLFKSVDGKSWTKLNEYYIDSYYVFDNGRITVNTALDGEFLSTDFGQTWAKVNYGTEYSKIIRIADNTFVEKDMDKHASLLISRNNGIDWEQIGGISKFNNIVDIEYNDEYLYLTNLSGLSSVPEIYKSPVDNWNWIKLTTLTKNPNNYPSIGKLKFFKDKVYALTDKHIYEIGFSGDTTSLTNDIINKINVISTFEISSEGNMLIGCNAGAFAENGVFYRKLSEN